MKALEAFIKLFEAPQKVWIKIKLFFVLRPVLKREELKISKFENTKPWR